MAIVITTTVTDANRDAASLSYYKGTDGAVHAQFSVPATNSGGEGPTVLQSDAVLNTVLDALVTAGTITLQQRNAYLPVTGAVREYFRTVILNAK